MDPFAGVIEVPGTQHPYAYGLNNPLRYTDPSGRAVPLLLAIPLLAAGITFIGGFAYQVFNNLEHGMSFWEATCHKNISWFPLLETSLSVGFTVFSFMTLVPFALFTVGQGLAGLGVLLGWSRLLSLGISVAGVGELLFYYFTTSRPLGVTPNGRITWTVDRALRQLAKKTGQPFTLCGGYGETEQGIYGRMAAEEVSERSQPVPQLAMPGWRNTGAPGGRDVDLWQPVSPEVEKGLRDIFGFQGEFDYYNKYHFWRGTMPPASRTYYPDGSTWQIPPNWGLPLPHWPEEWELP